MTVVETTRGVTNFFKRIGSQRAHGIDLLGDDHGS